MPKEMISNKPSREDLGEKIFVEKQEDRPNYRYYYHGTLKAAIDGIEKEGAFKFNEYHPSVSSSPLYSLGYTEGREDKTMKKIRKNDQESQVAGDKVMLVIEPEEGYQVYPTNEGLPEETDDQVETRGRFVSQHRYMAQEKKKKMGIYYEGDRPASQFSKDSIKMIIESTPELERIFQEFNQELNNGEVDEEKYIQKLLDFFQAGIGITKNEIENLRELAANMIYGHIEYYLAKAMRNIYLSIKHYQGKEVIKNREPLKPWSKKRLFRTMESLGNLEPKNKFFQNYIKSVRHYLDQELEEVQ